MKRPFFILYIFCVVVSSAQNKTQKYIDKYSQIAVDEMNRYNIPASITLAQGILESGNGESRLATEGKNHFGIKCHANWNGGTIIADDDEKGECFRKYLAVSDSYRDHSLFLSERDRYSFLFKYKKKDYKKWAKGLKKAGYATNPKYPTLLIDLIEKYDLSRFDKETETERQLYFANSYGLPYLTGIGGYYFKKESLYFMEVNTSFVFSEASVGYDHEILNMLYAGVNTGIFYVPFNKPSVIPHISSELMHKREKQKIILIRGGVQITLSDIHLFTESFNILPYFKLTYLLN
tara:strand:+ start:346 stop:1221 length:876 start_codon:yes stop_codon:yes gene_type:complete